MKSEPLKSAEPDSAPETLPELTHEAVAAHLAVVDARRAQFAEKLEERLGRTVPAADPDLEHDGEAWPARLPAEREAILPPSKPLIQPPLGTAGRATDHAGGDARSA